MTSYLRSFFGAGQRFVAAAGMAMSATPGPDTQSADAVAMAPKLKLIADVLEGADKIKAAGENYLPRFEAEDADNYKRRLADAPWRPILPSAIETLVSRPFSKPVTLTGKPSEKIKECADDIDRRGNNLTVFSKKIFDAAVTYGLSGILVDFPRNIVPENGRPITVAEEREQRIRPYWVQIRAEDLLAMHTSFVKGREIITHLRFKECSIEQDGFEEKYVERVRVIELDKTGRPHWSLWEKKSNSGYEEISNGDLTIDEIPFVPFFTGRRFGNFGVKPPLYDLAVMALEYYRSLARSTEIETFSGWPMLVGKGLSGSDANGAKVEVKVGPSTVLFAPGEHSDWRVIGPDAALVAEVAKSPDRVMEEFRRLAMEPQVPRAGNVTATASALDNSRAHSAIEGWAVALKDALEQAFVFTARWMAEPETVEVSVHTDFAVTQSDAADMAELLKARGQGEISRETYWDELLRRGKLGPQFDKAKELDRLEQEAPALGLIERAPEDEEPKDDDENENNRAKALVAANGDGKPFGVPVGAN